MGNGRSKRKLDPEIQLEKKVLDPSGAHDDFINDDVVVTHSNLTEKLKINKIRRKSIYGFIDSDENALINSLGEAIRRGKNDEIKDLIKTNPELIENNLGFELSVIKAQERELKKVVMSVSPLHLAIIARQTSAIDIILNAITSLDNFESIILEKTKIDFNDDDQFKYNEDDLFIDGINIFHLAARYFPAALDTLIAFIKSCDDEDHGIIMSKLINSKSKHFGMTPLHVASVNQSSDGLIILLENGAEIDTVTSNGYTALHCAVLSGSEINARFLIQDVGMDVDGRGSLPNYKTPLQLIKTYAMANLLISLNANQHALQCDPKTPDVKAISTFTSLLENNSDAANIILNDGILTNGKDLKASDLLIIFDFTQFYKEKKLTNDKRDEMSTMNLIIDKHQRHLLSHPKVEAFIHIKWTLGKWIYFFNFIFYLFYVLSLTSLSLLWTNIVHQENKIGNNSINTPANNSRYDIIEILLGDSNSEAAIPYLFLFSLTSITLLIIIIKELMQLYYNGTKHFKSNENKCELLQLMGSILFLVGTIFDLHKFSQHIVAMTVFMAWMILTNQIGRFPKVGQYVYAVTYVVDIFVWFCLVYFTILMAFAFAFCILLPNHILFVNPIASVLMVVAMMTGEYDFGANFDYTTVGTQDNHANGTVQFIFVLFVFIVTMIVGNLMVGLTVNSTDDLILEASNLRLMKSVKQISTFEKVFLRGPLSICFSKNFLNSFQIFQENNPSTDSKCLFSVCVAPNKFKTTNTLNGHTFIQKEYPVYYYDHLRNRRGTSFRNCKLPSGIIKNAFKLLKEEIDREITVKDNEFIMNRETSFTSYQVRRKNSSYYYY